MVDGLNGLGRAVASEKAAGTEVLLVSVSIPVGVTDAMDHTKKLFVVADMVLVEMSTVVSSCTQIPSPESYLKSLRVVSSVMPALSKQGAPGRGSTGVFEGVLNPCQALKVDNPAIPTLVIVQDTLSSHADEMEKVIDMSMKWGDRWLS